MRIGQGFDVHALVAGRPLIELTGRSLPAGNNTTGLTVHAGGSTVRGRAPGGDRSAGSKGFRLRF